MAEGAPRRPPPSQQRQQRDRDTGWPQATNLSTPRPNVLRDTVPDERDQDYFGKGGGSWHQPFGARGPVSSLSDTDSVVSLADMGSGDGRLYAASASLPTTARGASPRGGYNFGAGAASSPASSSYGPAPGSSPGRSGVSEAGRLAADLKKALAQADQRRQQAAERLARFEAEAEQEEMDLSEQLRVAQDNLRAMKSQRKRAYKEQRDEQLRAELREVEGEREQALREQAQLEAELRRARALADALPGLPSSPSPGSSAALTVAGVEAVGADAMQNMLRAEAKALRVALEFYKQQREDAAKENQVQREEQAIRQLQESQREEAQVLAEREDRLRASMACVREQKVAAEQARPPDDSLAQLEEAEARLKAREVACQQLEESLEPLRDECAHLLRLTNAAEARMQDLEKRLQVGVRAPAEQAVKMLKRLGLQGPAALVFVLARVCGDPRLAFLALDSNHSGRLSTVEFDSGLRLRFSLDFEAITGQKLRALFKEFDRKRCGVITEEDFAACCPEVWERYGRPACGGAERLASGLPSPGLSPASSPGGRSPRLAPPSPASSPGGGAARRGPSRTPRDRSPTPRSRSEAAPPPEPAEEVSRGQNRTPPPAPEDPYPFRIRSR